MPLVASIDELTGANMRRLPLYMIAMAFGILIKQRPIHFSLL